MSNKTLLDYKRVLVVDDEPDVLDTLEQLLPMCDVAKEEMTNITTYLSDILEAREQGKHVWWRWLDRLGAYAERLFFTERTTPYPGVA